MYSSPSGPWRPAGPAFGQRSNLYNTFAPVRVKQSVAPSAGKAARLLHVAILALALAATGGRWRPFLLGGPNLAEVPERTKTRTQLLEEAINAAPQRKRPAAPDLNQA